MTTDWRANLLDSLRNPDAMNHKPREKNKFIIQGHVPAEYIHLFDRTTAHMDYSQASWLRRAVAIPLSRQTGVPLAELLAATTQVRRRGQAALRYPDLGTGDTGQDLHLFCGHPGCDGDHFR